MPDEILDKSLLSKYKDRLEQELGAKNLQPGKSVVSKEYSDFREEILPRHLSIYEKLCDFCGRIFKIKPPKHREAELLEAIEMCHLKVTPTGVISFSIVAPILFGIILSLIFYSISGSFFFVYFFLIVAIFLIMPLGKLPDFLATTWRLKSSNQMVLCIFYVVTYMRHTSNIELALDFAAEHLTPPLSLDIKKVLWDIETEKYPSVKESLDAYLKTWKNYNLEFIEAFHMIESSLYEGTEEKRLAALDKGLDLILEETYEKMLHYAHNLKSPITMLHMLGIILPILGLVILPLVVSFIPEIQWYHLSTIYNLFLPILVYIMGKKILATRPTGYGDTDISEDNPQLKKYRNILFTIGKTEVKINPMYISIMVFLILMFIGFLPLLMHAADFPDMGWGRGDSNSPCGRNFCLLGFEKDEDGNVIGPYGLGAGLLSMGITLALGISLGLYFKLKSKNVIKIREESKRLEEEFAGALFQLGNRLGDGIPTEMAVGRVSETMEGTVSGKFFELVSNNIRRLGMSVEQAIFDEKYGALLYYPSRVIESSMKVLTESIKKGPSVAALALMNVSKYIKEIHRVNERLKDLLADVISSMKSQIKFLAPVISGIVIGITSMITNILGKLSGQLGSFGDTSGSNVPLDLPNLLGGRGIPLFYFQIMVGVYVVQITYILTVLANGIENGSDSLNERYELGVNLIRSTFMYVFISGTVTVLFSIIASNILPNL
ncbi:hypothetical protein HY638_03625 [Candidatus Woesearchaeota archaeon]|nr:hypothetical protein [Candidatus Woesearchaeota archaeon]